MWEELKLKLRSKYAMPGGFGIQESPTSKSSASMQPSSDQPRAGYQTDQALLYGTNILRRKAFSKKAARNAGLRSDYQMSAQVVSFTPTISLTVFDKHDVRTRYSVYPPLIMGELWSIDYFWVDHTKASCD